MFSKQIKKTIREHNRRTHLRRYKAIYIIAGVAIFQIVYGLFIAAITADTLILK